MPENLIHESRHFTTRQATDTCVPGHLVVASKAPCTSLDGFTPDQAADLMRCLVQAETLVQQILQPERIYVLKFGAGFAEEDIQAFIEAARARLSSPRPVGRPGAPGR